MTMKLLSTSHLAGEASLGSAGKEVVGAGSSLAVAPRRARLGENPPRDPQPWGWCLSRVEHTPALHSTVLAEASGTSSPMVPGYRSWGLRASPRGPV